MSSKERWKGLPVAMSYQEGAMTGARSTPLWAAATPSHGVEIVKKSRMPPVRPSSAMMTRLTKARATRPPMLWATTASRGYWCRTYRYCIHRSRNVAVAFRGTAVG